MGKGKHAEGPGHTIPSTPAFACPVPLARTLACSAVCTSSARMTSVPPDTWPASLASASSSCRCLDASWVCSSCTVSADLSVPSSGEGPRGKGGWVQADPPRRADSGRGRPSSPPATQPWSQGIGMAPADAHASLGTAHLSGVQPLLLEHLCTLAAAARSAPSLHPFPVEQGVCHCPNAGTPPADGPSRRMACHNSTRPPTGPSGPLNRRHCRPDFPSTPPALVFNTPKRMRTAGSSSGKPSCSGMYILVLPNSLHVILLASARAARARST